MKPLLFLTQRIPYPPNKGDKLRSFAVLRHLAKTWDIHLGCFVDDPDDWRHVDVLREFCRDLCCVKLDKRAAKVRSLGGLLRGTSLSEAYFHSAGMAGWVETVLREVRPSSVFLFSSVMARYVPRGGPLRPGRVVMDFVDVDSDKWSRYAARSSWPMSAIYRHESRALLAFDRKVAADFDAAVFVSPPEAELFRRLAPETSAKLHAIPNGIDHSYFSPALDHPDPFPDGTRPLVLTGAMDYWPNIDAACWFAEEIFPGIRSKVPEACFVIVGSNPTPQVKKLGERPGITVTGRVPDIRPYLAHAAIVVAPLRIARGIQNKVLEGMSMGKAVVTTSQGLEGIDALPGRDLLTADDAQSFTMAALRALTDEATGCIGASARRRIVASYGWEDKLAAYDRLLGGTDSADFPNDQRP